MLTAAVTGAVVALLGVWLSAAQADEHRQEGSWSDGGALNVDRDQHSTATQLDDGRVLLVGGQVIPESASIWDPATRESELIDPPSMGWTDHAAVRLDDGRVLVLGGDSGPEWAAEIYDPDEEGWAEASSMEHSRRWGGHTATRLDDGRVLVTGGRGRKKPPRVDNEGEGITALSDGEIFVGSGGYDSSDSRCCIRVVEYQITQESLAADDDVTINLDSVQSSVVDFSDGDDAYESESGEVTATVDSDTATLTFSPHETLEPGATVSVGIRFSGLTVEALTESKHFETLLSRGDTDKPARAIFSVWRVLRQAAAEVYDPDADEWTTIESMEHARAHHTATRLDDGRVLVVGGEHGDGHHSSAEVFNPAVGEWSTVDSMAEGRAQHTATRLESGKVLVTGGSWEGQGHQSSVDVYDPEAGVWELREPMSEERGNHTATLLDDGTVLVVHGETAERYDPDADEWWAADAPGNRRHGHSAVVLDEGHVAMFGSPLSRVQSEVDVYSPQTLPTPQITGISPERGSVDGGYEVTITGNHLDEAHFARFGGRHAGETMQDSDGQLRVVAPKHPARENVPVTVTTSGGTSEPTEFTFEADDGHWDPTGDLIGGIRSTGIGAVGTSVLDGPVCEPVAAPPWCGQVLITGIPSQVYDPETGAFQPRGAPANDPVTADFANKTTVLDGPVCRQAPAAHWCGEVLAVSDLLAGPVCRQAPAAALPCGEVPAVSDPLTGLTPAPSNAFRYDPASGQWRPTSPLPDPPEPPDDLPDDLVDDFEPVLHTTLIDGPECRGHDAAEAVVDAPEHCGKVLAGTHDISGVPGMWLYDPATETWTETAAPTEKRSHYSMTLVDGAACDGDDPPDACGNVLITSGTWFQPGQDVRTQTAELYDPATQTWRETAEGPGAGRQGATATSMPDGRVLVAGGHLDVSGIFGIAEAETFDPTDESWQPVPQMLEARAGHSAVALPDGRVMLAGGTTTHPIANGETEATSVVVFDPTRGENGEWFYTDSMDSGRADARHVGSGGFPLARLRNELQLDVLDDTDQDQILAADGPALEEPSADGGVSTAMSAELYTPELGVVLGEVVDAATDEPITGADVTLTDEGGDEVAATSTDGNGDYQFDEIDYGDYQLTVDADDYESQSQDVGVVAGDNPVDFALELLDAGAVTGEVSDTVSGDAVPGADVVVEDGDGDEVVTAGTDDDGAYEGSGLRPGEYTLTADADGYAPAEQPVTVESGQTATANFALEPEEVVGAVTGTITDLDSGEPVAGADLIVADDDGETVVTAGTDDGGAYEASGLEPGEYLLTVEADGYQTASQSVEVVAGETASVDFALQPIDDAGRLEGVVLDAESGAALPGALVTVVDDAGDEVVSARTDEDGEWWVAQLAADTYTLTVELDGYQPATQEATVEAGETVTVDFRLTPDGTVAPLEEGAAGVGRVAGADRFATAARLSAQAHPDGSEVAYVATGLGFADALTGGVAAALTDAPVLLTATSQVPEATATELDRLDPHRLVILGGEAAVDGDAEAELARHADRVDRLAGTDRFATAAAVSQAAFPDRADTVYVATGGDFPDALAAVSPAADAGAPLLLATRGELTEPTEDELARLDPDRIVLLGGTAALGEPVAQAAGEFADTVDRVAGATRFSTAEAVVADRFGSAEQVFVATGVAFPDALAGGAAAGARAAPLLLSAPDDLTDPTRRALDRFAPQAAVLLGGTAALTPTVEQQLREAVAATSDRTGTQ